MTDRPATEPRTDLSDADKLLLLAAWFDMWDSMRYEDRQRLLDDENNPGKNDVQRDLRRIAASLAEAAQGAAPLTSNSGYIGYPEDRAAPRAEGLDVTALIDALYAEVDRTPEKMYGRRQGIKYAIGRIKEAARLSRPSDERDDV